MLCRSDNDERNMRGSQFYIHVAMSHLNNSRPTVNQDPSTKIHVRHVRVLRTATIHDDFSDSERAKDQVPQDTVRHDTDNVKDECTGRRRFVHTEVERQGCDTPLHGLFPCWDQ
jgi:hypothetical protein